MLSNVSDIYGNYIMSPVTWSFTFADFGTANASVYVSGARLSTTHATFLTKTNEAASIQTHLASYFGISTARIKSVSALRTVDALTAFTFIIAPSNNLLNKIKSATWLANNFARDMAALNSTFNPFATWTSLSPLIRSTVRSLWVTHRNKMGLFRFVAGARECDFACDPSPREHDLPIVFESLYVFDDYQQLEL
jgi:hypothetical protein